MSAPKHFRGPYRAEFGAIHHEAERGFLFAVEPAHVADMVADAQNKADAAPDLLGFAVALDADWTKEFPDGPDTDFSKRLIDLAPETVALWRQCRAAIAKATGAET